MCISDHWEPQGPFRASSCELRAGVTDINLSLDTLDPFQFTLTTRRNGHEAVMKSMNQILAMNRGGQASIKLKVNCVVIRLSEGTPRLSSYGIIHDKASEGGTQYSQLVF
jgi:hypothetical protein